MSKIQKLIQLLIIITTINSKKPHNLFHGLHGYHGKHASDHNLYYPEEYPAHDHNHEHDHDHIPHYHEPKTCPCSHPKEPHYLFPPKIDYKGPMGYQGKKGGKGEDGVIGNTGPKGCTGGKGSDGGDGDDGDQGDKGDKGVSGADAVDDGSADGSDGSDGRDGRDLGCDCREKEYLFMVCKSYCGDDFGGKCMSEILELKNCYGDCLKVDDEENSGCESNLGNCRSQCDEGQALVICDKNREKYERSDCRTACELQKDNCDRTENCIKRKIKLLNITPEAARTECVKFYPKNILPYEQQKISINTPEKFLNLKDGEFGDDKFFADVIDSATQKFTILLTKYGYQIKVCRANKYFFLDAERKVLNNTGFSEIISTKVTGVSFNPKFRNQGWSIIFSSTDNKYIIKYKDPLYTMCNWGLDLAGTGEPEGQVVIREDSTPEWVIQKFD